MKLALALVAFSLLAPAVAAQAGPGETAKVTFYGHVFAHGLDFPMPSNDQPPIGEEVYGLGSTSTCTPAGSVENYVLGVPNPRPGVTCDQNEFNKLALFSSAGFVDVKGRDEFNSKGDYTLFHNERGLTKEVLLDPNEDVTASIWMSLDTHSWFVGGGNNETDCPYDNPRDVGCVYPYWGWDPAVWPDWQVTATLYAANLGAHGSAPSEAPPIRAAIENGEARVIAHGETTPQQITNGLPGNPNVHQFVVNLGKPVETTIKREENFFLVFSWNTNTGGNEFNYHNWRIWAGEFYPPVYTLPVQNAFDVELVVPNFLHDKLVIVGVMNTPWGSYDVDPAMTRLVIQEKTSGREVTPFRIDTFEDYSVAHGGHYLPVNQTWIWDYKRDGLAPGTYTVTVSAMNWAHTAMGRCTGEFTVLDGGRPGPTVIGECGMRTADDEFVEAVSNLEGEGNSGEAETLVPLPVSVLSAGVQPAPGPWGLLAAAAAGAAAVALRRWRA